MLVAKTLRRPQLLRWTTPRWPNSEDDGVQPRERRHSIRFLPSLRGRHDDPRTVQGLKDGSLGSLAAHSERDHEQAALTQHPTRRFTAQGLLDRPSLHNGRARR